MNKFFKEQVTVVVQQNKVLQNQVSTRKKERGNLQKQIDNLMAQNNFLRCQSSTGKYQLQLIEKDREIKMLKQKYQKELNSLQKKLLNSSNTKTMYDSVRLVEKQTDKIQLDPGFRRLYNSNRLPNTQCDKCNIIKKETQLREIEWSKQKQKILKSSIIIGKGEKEYDQRIIQYNKEIRNLKQKLEEKDQMINNINQILIEVKQFNEQLKKDLQTYKSKSVLENSNYKELIEQMNREIQCKDEELTLLRLHNNTINNEENQQQPEIRVNYENNPNNHNYGNLKLQNAYEENISPTEQNYQQQINQLRNQINSLVELNNLKSYNQQEFIILKEKYQISEYKNMQLAREIDKLNKIVEVYYQEKQRYMTLNTINYNLAKKIEQLESANNGLNYQLSKHQLSRSNRTVSSATNHNQEYQDGVQIILDRLSGQNNKIYRINQQLSNSTNLKNKSTNEDRLIKSHERNKSETYYTTETARKYIKPINSLLTSPSMSEKTQPHHTNIQSKINLLRNETKQISKFLNKMF